MPADSVGTPVERNPLCEHSSQSWYVAKGKDGAPDIHGCTDCDAERQD